MLRISVGVVWKFQILGHTTCALYSTHCIEHCYKIMRLVALFCRTPSPAARAQWLEMGAEKHAIWHTMNNISKCTRFRNIYRVRRCLGLCSIEWRIPWKMAYCLCALVSQMQFTFLPTKRHWIGHTNSSNSSTSDDVLSARIPGSVAEKFQWFWTKPSTAYVPHSQAHHLAPCIYANSCIHSTIASFRLFFILITFKFACFVPSWRCRYCVFFGISVAAYFGLVYLFSFGKVWYFVRLFCHRVFTWIGSLSLFCPAILAKMFSKWFPKNHANVLGQNRLDKLLY